MEHEFIVAARYIMLSGNPSKRRRTWPQGQAALAIAAILGTLAAWAPAGDWPQWRGPRLNGSTDETNLPVEFSKTENIAWMTPLPGGSGATPIVIGERIFLVSAHRRTDDLIAMCISATDGKVLWEKTLSRGRIGDGRGEIAACSPVSDGKSVWFLFGSGLLTKTDLDGNILWQRDLVKDYGCLAIKFGYSASPLLHAGKLYLPLLRREKPYAYSPGADVPYTGDLVSLVLCHDAATGQKLWAQRRDTDAVDESRETYITPMPVEAAGRTEIIICGGQFVTAHDANSGKELWRWEYTKKREIWQRIVANPVVGFGLIFTCQANSQGVYALRPGGSGIIPHDKYAWVWDANGSDVCTPLLYGENLYVLDGDKKVMTCLAARTGKIKWSGQLEAKGPFRASPTGADGKIYCISEGGDYVVLAAGDEFKELFRFSTKAQPCRSTIVATNGSLYLRIFGLLICVRKTPAEIK